MADISDVLDAIYDLALAACYPNGGEQPSVTGGNNVLLAQGWPKPDDLKRAIQATPQQTLVTIYPLPGMSASQDQPMQSGNRVIVPPVHGMSATATAAGVVTLSGAPGVGEYATVVVNGEAYSYVAFLGESVQVVASALAAKIAADFPGTSASGPAVTIVHATTLQVRIGAPGTLGDLVGRHREIVRITVWAPSAATRSQVARVVDVAIKSQVTLDMPDTTRVIMRYQGGGWHDNMQNEGEFRRDIDVSVLYDTYSEYPGYEVTYVDAQLTQE